MFIVVGIAAFFAFIFQVGDLSNEFFKNDQVYFRAYLFGISGENLTKRLRSKAFQAMLSQELGWFDDASNNVGALCTRLSTEASAVQDFTGVRFGNFFVIFGSIGVGLILSFINSWPLALIMLAFIPFIIISFSFKVKMMAGLASTDTKSLEEAGNVIESSKFQPKTSLVNFSSRLQTKQ